MHNVHAPAATTARFLLSCLSSTARPVTAAPTSHPPPTAPCSASRPPQSAALGLAIAGALGLGYANIFVTAPSPENLRTLFEFVFKGLDALGYQVGRNRLSHGHPQA